MAEGLRGAAGGCDVLVVSPVLHALDFAAENPGELQSLEAYIISQQSHITLSDQLTFRAALKKLGGELPRFQKGPVALLQTRALWRRMP